MDIEKLVKTIESCMKQDIDVNEIEGPYAVKGMFMDKEQPVELLEVGKDYEPIIQIRLKPQLKVDERNKSHYKSYLMDTGFSGTAYSLTEEQYADIEALLKENN